MMICCSDICEMFMDASSFNGDISDVKTVFRMFVGTDSFDHLSKVRNFVFKILKNLLATGS